ncbi:hypothetical protein B0H66DRAFT_4417 [Apodospora peruviana]|uniref:Uncharacterized protein n=1 Tax=Apodospora peruviana TaxID=516989 RepID=A0AAE0IPP7_9PEZI|nr:hypothetical protein B0H66DRAFT_4417 [Apodospora peruviana]
MQRRLACITKLLLFPQDAHERERRGCPEQNFVLFTRILTHSKYEVAPVCWSRSPFSYQRPQSNSEPPQLRESRTESCYQDIFTTSAYRHRVSSKNYSKKFMAWRLDGRQSRLSFGSTADEDHSEGFMSDDAHILDTSSYESEQAIPPADGDHSESPSLVDADMPDTSSHKAEQEIPFAQTRSNFPAKYGDFPDDDYNDDKGEEDPGNSSNPLVIVDDYFTKMKVPSGDIKSDDDKSWESSGMEYSSSSFEEVDPQVLETLRRVDKAIRFSHGTEQAAAVEPAAAEEPRLSILESIPAGEALEAYEFRDESLAALVQSLFSDQVRRKDTLATVCDMETGTVFC